MLGCGWNAGYSWSRIGICIGAVVFGVISFAVTILRRSRLTYLLMVFLLGAGLGFAWLTYMDSARVDASQKWCKGGLSGINFMRKPEKLSCHYGDSIVICVLDAFAAVAWILLAFFTSLYKHNAPEYVHKHSSSKKKQQKKSTKSNNNNNSINSKKKQKGKSSYDYDDDDETDFAAQQNPLIDKTSSKVTYGTGDDDEEDYDGGNGGEDSYGPVDFDSASKRRYPQLQQQQQQQQQQQHSSSELPRPQALRTQQDEQPSRLSAKYSHEGDFDFSQIAEDNNSSKTGNSRGLKSAVSEQAARMPPLQPTTTLPKMDSASPRRQQQKQQQQQQQQHVTPPQHGSFKDNGDFDFESLEGNNGFDD